MNEFNFKEKSIGEKLKKKIIDWLFKEFREEQNRDIEQLYKNINELDKRVDLFFESVNRFLPKIYEVYHKNQELQKFRSRYMFNSDARELRKFTEEKFEEEIKEILKRVDTNE